MIYGYDKIQEVFTSKGYKFFTGVMSINVFSIRCDVSDYEYDDLTGCAWIDDNEVKRVLLIQSSTEPGKKYKEVKLLNPDGAAIMIEGQYRSSFQIGTFHKGRWCLRQVKPCRYYRDGDKDNNHDLSGKVYTGNFSTHIHDDFGEQAIDRDVWSASAGCHVVEKSKFLRLFKPVVEKSAGKYGDKFTYTLLNVDDFK